MSKLARAALISALILTVEVPKASFAIPVLPVPPAVPVPPVAPTPDPPAPHVAAGSSSAAGVAITGGFLGFVASLVLYDMIRRTTCSGDFLHLGGPGFTSPITPQMGVLPVMCVPVPYDHERKRKRRGQH